MSNGRCTGAELEPEADVPAGKTRLYSNFNPKWTIRPNLYHVKCLVKLMRQRNSCTIYTRDHTVIERKMSKRYPDLCLNAVRVRENWTSLKHLVSVLIAMKLVYGITVDPRTGLLNCTDEQWAIVKRKFYSFGNDRKRFRNYMDIQELQWAMMELPNYQLDTKFFRDGNVAVIVESMLNGTEVNGMELCKQRLRLRNVCIPMPVARQEALPDLENNESNQLVLYKPKKEKNNTRRQPKTSELSIKGKGKIRSTISQDSRRVKKKSTTKSNIKMITNSAGNLTKRQTINSSTALIPYEELDHALERIRISHSPRYNRKNEHRVETIVIPSESSASEEEENDIDGFNNYHKDQLNTMDQNDLIDDHVSDEITFQAYTPTQTILGGNGMFLIANDLSLPYHPLHAYQVHQQYMAATGRRGYSVERHMTPNELHDTDPYIW